MAKSMAYISSVLLLAFLTSSHVSARELSETSSRSNLNDNFEHPMNSMFGVSLKNKIVQLRPSILQDDNDDDAYFIDPYFLPTFLFDTDIPPPPPFPPPLVRPYFQPFGSLSIKDGIEGYQRVLHRSFDKSFGMKNGGKTGYGVGPSMEDTIEDTKNYN
ncbi:hypothetical protein RIF29_42436 [Crotalaria pallida]|uniref:Uncharacterized protein n=1 Tax=Crotalaria pallida TaxID=3830 RepID=A0AAN9E7K2_CROPI